MQRVGRARVVYSSTEKEAMISDFDSEKYKSWIRLLPCLACGDYHSVPHHVRLPGHCGMGQKPDDLFCVPLGQIPCHNELHNIGEMRFWDQHNIDIKMEIISLHVRYFNLEAIPF